MRGTRLEGFWRRAGGDRRRFVDETFASVARDYDRLVRLFSGGLDRRWRRTCVEACEIARGGWILDCATGTGALALAAAQRARGTRRVVAVDPCGPMLREARRNASKVRTPLVCIQAHAEHLPLRSEAVSTITLGLGLRHMNLKETLEEISRVLTPGGRVALLDFLRPPPGLAPWVALAYLRWIVPPLAGLVAWSRAAWTLAAYLPRTIEAGPTLPTLVEAVESVGLGVVKVKPLFARVVWLIVAMKPRGPFPHEIGE